MKDKKLRVTLLLTVDDLWRLSDQGLTVLAVEETTPAGWTRRIPATSTAKTAVVPCDGLLLPRREA